MSEIKPIKTLLGLSPVSEDVVNLLFSGCLRRERPVAKYLKHFWQEDKQGNRFIPGNKIGFVIQNVIDAYKDETLGFLERSSPSGSVLLSLEAMLAQKTLSGALRLHVKFWTYIHRDFNCEIITQSTQTKIRLNFVKSDLSANEKLMFYMLFSTFFCKWMSWSTGSLVTPKRFNCQNSIPSFGKDLDNLFPCEMYYSQTENTLIFKRSVFELPVTKTLADIKPFIDSIPHMVIATYSAASTKEKIKHSLN